MNAREASLREMVRDFPESALTHFSLGKYLLEAARYDEAIAALKSAVQADPAYAAAWLALGETLAALGEKDAARDALARCAQAALAQGHPELAAEAEERAEGL
jgi:predicted Zn-dependent protease